MFMPAMMKTSLVVTTVSTASAGGIQGTKLSEGDLFPRIYLSSADGEKIAIHAEGRPKLVVFYRGSFCRFCACEFDTAPAPAPAAWHVFLFLILMLILWSYCLFYPSTHTYIQIPCRRSTAEWIAWRSR
jgi:hypothetical protein